MKTTKFFGIILLLFICSCMSQKAEVKFVFSKRIDNESANPLVKKTREYLSDTVFVDKFIFNETTDFICFDTFVWSDGRLLKVYNKNLYQITPLPKNNLSSDIVVTIFGIKYKFIDSLNYNNLKVYRFKGLEEIEGLWQNYIDIAPYYGVVKHHIAFSFGGVIKDYELDSIIYKRCNEQIEQQLRFNSEFKYYNNSK